MKTKMSIILIIIFSIWVIMSVPAVTISDATIRLGNDNGGTISVNYKLSDHDIRVLSSEKKATMTLAKGLLGLNEDGSGTYSFTENNMTQWADMNGQRVLLFSGFYFDKYDWRTDNTLISEYPRLAVINPDFQPDLITIIWPDNREIQLENVTYIPNMYIKV